VHVLHAVHDFLPRHRAGSEIYAHALACAQLTRHHVTVLSAEYDPQRAHGHVDWRVHEGVPVVEIVNNWVVTSFEDTYRPELIGQRLDQLLEVLQPDIVHIHSLLNLSFELPAMARARGIPVVATLHDYTLVCPAGGQRIHKKDAHVCHQIDTLRCTRCFTESPFHNQMSFAALATRLPGGSAFWRSAGTVGRLFPQLVRHGQRAIAHASRVTHTTEDIDARLLAAREVLAQLDLVVAPSQSLAREFEAFGLAADRAVVSDYGFVPLPIAPQLPHTGPVRFGFVGTLVWHKGPHVLLEAVASLDPRLFEVVIYGDTQTFPDYTSELRRLAAGLPVRFMGPFESGQVADVYANIDVLIVPSLWLENSPLVIHEAFMAGIPVVGSRIGGIADLVSDGVNGLLYEAASPASLTQALRRLIDAPDIRARLANAAPRVKTIHEDADEWEVRYAELVAARRPEGTP